MDGVWTVEESFMLLSFLYLPIYSLFWWFCSLAFTILIYTARSLLDSWTRPKYAPMKQQIMLHSFFMNWVQRKWTSGYEILCATPPADSQLKFLVANCYPASRASAELRHRELYSLSRDLISARQDLSLWDAIACCRKALSSRRSHAVGLLARQCCSVCVEAYGLPNAVPPRHTGTARTCFLFCF